MKSTVYRKILIEEFNEDDKIKGLFPEHTKQELTYFYHQNARSNYGFKTLKGLKNSLGRYLRSDEVIHGTGPVHIVIHVRPDFVTADLGFK